MKSVVLISFIFISCLTFGQNRINKEGKKQGLWTMEAMDTLYFDFLEIQNGKLDSTAYAKYIKLEGQYSNDKKTGIWTSNGGSNYKLSTVTFLDGKPNGEIVVYYSNQTIMYQGYIEKDSKTVELQTRASAGKYYSTVTLSIDEMLEKWTFIRE